MKINSFRGFALLALIFLRTQAVVAAPGEIDLTFGKGGKVTQAMRAGFDQNSYAALQTDGKIVTVGTLDMEFTIARYKPDGSLDASFGQAGQARVYFGEDLYQHAPCAGVVIQSDGKIVVAGTTESSTYLGFALARLNTDGTLDPAFGTNGLIRTSFSYFYDPEDGYGGFVVEQDSLASGLVLQPDGKIVVCGYDDDSDMQLARYNTDGSLDSTFGINGKANREFYVSLPHSQRFSSVGGYLSGIALQPDGKFVGIRGSEVIEVVRFNSNGSPDSGFGTNGLSIFDLTPGYGYFNHGNAIAIQRTDGKILVGGYLDSASGADFVLLRCNSNGTLDSSFGNAGVALTDFGSVDYIRSLAIQADGKILAAGVTEQRDSNYTTISSDYALARYNANGTLDTTFNSNGKTTIDLGRLDGARSILIQSNDKLVLAGASGDNFGLARLNSDGTLDTTFSSDGKVTTGFFRDSRVNALAMLQDGRILAAGNARNLFGLVQKLADGSNDASFGTSGVAELAFAPASISVVNAVALQADGKAVAVGSTQVGNENSFAVARLVEGNLEVFVNYEGGCCQYRYSQTTTSFGLGDAGATAVAIQADGNIVAGGYTWNGSDYDFALARYLGSNVLSDTSFGTAGLVRTSIGSSDDGINALSIQADGKIVAAGYSMTGGNFDFALARYNANGSLDSSFGSGGKVVMAFGGGFDEIHAVAIQADGKIVVAGTTQNSGGSYDFALARFNSNGTLDSNFASGGKVTTTFGVNDVGNALALYRNGKIVVAGTSSSLTSSLFAVAVYNYDGSLDTTFNGTGKLTGSFGGTKDGANAIALQANGNIVLGGYTHDSTNFVFGLARIQGPLDQAVSFTSSSFSINENAAQATIGVQLSTPSAQTVRIKYSTANGTASVGSDYTAVSGTLLFAPGETNKTFIVPILSDTVDEANETVQLNLFDPKNCVLGAGGSAILTIVDDDPPVVVQFSANNNYTFNENSGTATVTVSLNTPSSLPVTVRYDMVNGTAQAGTDYVALSGTITFQPGETAKTITATILDDGIQEPLETFSIALSSPANATLGASSVATLTILDADAPSAQFSSASYTVNEYDSFVILTVTLSFAPTQITTVQYSTANGSATTPGDYTNTTGTLTFNPGQTNQNIFVPIKNDAVNEPDETFTVSLSNPVHAVLAAPATTTVTIVDNSTPPAVSFRNQFIEADGSIHVTEGWNLLFIPVELSKSFAQTASVDYVIVPGSATFGVDFTNVAGQSGTLVFAPGVMTRSVSLSGIQDSLIEGNETFTILLLRPTNCTPTGITNMAVTIMDDEPLPTIGIIGLPGTFTGSPISENVGTLMVTLQRSVGMVNSSSVDFSTVENTARAGVDYIATNGTLSFGPGETNKSFAVPILNNSIYQSNRAFSIALSRPINAQLELFSGRGILIVEDDPPPAVAFDNAAYSVDETAGSATITVNLGVASNVPASVDFATRDLSAAAGLDYTGTNGTLTFAPGEISKSFTIPIIADALDETDETVLLALSNPTNATLGAISNATLTIVDANAPPIARFSSLTYSANENLKGGLAIVTVLLSAASGQAISLSYSALDGTANAPADFTAVNGVLNFGPGETNKTFSVPIVNDSIVELNETVLLSLSKPTHVTLGAPATLTILDDDAPLVSFVTNFFRVSENNGEALIGVKLSAASGRIVSLNYSAIGGTATDGSDFKSIRGLLVFNPGETNKTFSIPIYDDGLDEPDETVLLTLSNPTNGIAGAPATLAIVDDDPPLASFSSGNYTVNEDAGSISIAVRLSTAFDQTVYVDFTTSDETARAGSDYIANSGTLVFAPGQTNKTFFVNVLDDALAEGNETVHLSIGNLVNATEGAFTKSVLTIVDDDYARLSIQPVGTNLILSWTNTAVGFVLQSTRSLTPGNSWSNISAAVLSTNGQNQSSVPANPPSQYYRLRKP